jgi:hypothetical protein
MEEGTLGQVDVLVWHSIASARAFPKHSASLVSSTVGMVPSK